MKKGVYIGIIWAFLSWVPFYTGYLLRFKNILGLPAVLGLNFELYTRVGDAFIYSILIGVIVGGLAELLLKNYISIRAVLQRKENILLLGGFEKMLPTFLLTFGMVFG